MNVSSSSKLSASQKLGAGSLSKKNENWHKLFVQKWETPQPDWTSPLGHQMGKA
jgi:hypothetical protein